MSVLNNVLGSQTKLAPAKPKLTTAEQRALEGRLFRVTLIAAAFAAAALYTTNSFVTPKVPTEQIIRVAPTPLM